MKVTDLKTDELVQVYIQLRDRRAARKAAYENEDSADKTKQEKVEAVLLKRFQEQNLESVKTPNGTAYKTTKASCTVADWDSFLNQYVVPNQAWELLVRGASKDSVRQFIAENNGALPPGINWREEVAINVRRS